MPQPIALRSSLRILVLGGIALSTACSSSSSEDAGTTPSDSGHQHVTDSGVTPTDAGVQMDATVQADSGVHPDAQPVDSGPPFDREVTLGYDEGTPFVKLVADPSTEARLRVTPDSMLSPVEIRQVKFIPASAHSGEVFIKTEAFALPSTVLGSATYTVTANDVDQWFTVDLSSQHIRADSVFWVVIAYPSTLGMAQQTLYGVMSSSGHNVYFKTGYPPYTVNFDAILRVVVATTDDSAPPALGQDGDACTAGVDCTSGYCSAGRCTISCANGENCGTGRSCYALELGHSVCVTDCTMSSQCPMGSFCLTDTTFIDPAGLCIKGGPVANGGDCQYHYHTICAGGLCGACANDPTLCADPGTCSDM